YLPLGGLLAGTGKRWLPALIRATLAAGCLSLLLETSQLFIPGRVSSLLDTSLNTLGAFLGAGLALALRNHVDKHERAGWRAWLSTDRVSQVGAAALAAWLCAQLIPFVPSLDVSTL